MIDTAPLIAEITAAFDGVSRAGGVSLHESEVLDWAGPDDARAAARLLDTDTRWQDVSDADAKYYHSSMYFLDAIGFRYYLPVFMIYALRYSSLETDFDSVLAVTLWQLEPNQHQQKRYEEVLHLMTRPQKQAIGNFLQLIVAHADDIYRADPARVLHDYWKQYCDSDTE